MVISVLLIWINGAVGIIGDGPINLLYLFVILFGIAGAIVCQLKARGMAITLCAVAAAQMTVPVIALLLNQPDSPGVLPVFLLNGVFAAFWLLSALLFRQAAKKESVAMQSLAG